MEYSFFSFSLLFPAHKASPTTTGTAATEFAYDSIGRVIRTLQNLPGHTTLSSAIANYYHYDEAGDLKEEDYPSGGSVGPNATTAANTYTYDATGALLSLDNSLVGNVVQDINNGPFGPNSYGLPNHFYIVPIYDSMGRQTGSGFCALTTEIYSTYCNNGATAQVWESTIKGSHVTWSNDFNLGASSQPIYDKMDRLTAINYSNSTSMQWTYDRYGNRWTQSSPGLQTSLQFDLSSNHVVGATYDAAGNMTVDPSGNHYTYDADGNLVSSTVGSVISTSTYNALNQRVAYTSGSTTTLSTFNPWGQRLAQYDGNENFQHHQIYWGSTPVAYIAPPKSGYPGYPDGYVRYQVLDPVGSVFSTSDFYVDGTYFRQGPFGDNQSVVAGSGTDDDPLHFAGLDKDADGTHHAQFRNYIPDMARWSSPDPYLGSYVPQNPQSLNRYSYALNNPLLLVDPSGLDYCEYFVGDQHVLVEEVDYTPDYNDCISSGGAYYKDASYEGGGVGGGWGGGTAGGGGFGGGGGNGGGGGTGNPNAPSNWSRINKVLQCGSKTANQFSIAGVLGWTNENEADSTGTQIGKTIGTAFLGNTFSGISDTITHVATGHFGAAYGDFALGGTAQGLPIGTVAASKGVVGLTTDAALGAAVGEEMATPVGWAKLAIDGATYLGSLAYCSAHQ